MEVTLGKTPTDIMTADLSKVQYGVFDGVFDCTFENIKLSITNTDHLTSKTIYTSIVNWNLIDVPNSKTDSAK